MPICSIPLIYPLRWHPPPACYVSIIVAGAEIRWWISSAWPVFCWCFQVQSDFLVKCFLFQVLSPASCTFWPLMFLILYPLCHLQWEVHAHERTHTFTSLSETALDKTITPILRSYLWLWVLTWKIPVIIPYLPPSSGFLKNHIPLSQISVKYSDDCKTDFSFCPRPELRFVSWIKCRYWHPNILITVVFWVWRGHFV